jgi:ribosomal protein S18 acetylase RimI-like enzyme
LLRKWPRLVGAMAANVFSVVRVKRIIETLWHTRTRKAQNGEELGELLSIAVDPLFQGTGRAQLLYSDLCARFLARGVNRFQIVVGSQLIQAQRFYVKMGARAVASVEVHKGTASVVYVQDCDACR